MSFILGDDFEENFDKLFFYVPIFIPEAQKQIMFNDSLKNSFILPSDSFSPDRKTVDTHLEYQVDIGSALNFNSPKYLIVAHEKAAKVVVPSKINNVSIFHNLNVRKYLVDTDGVIYP